MNPRRRSRVARPMPAGGPLEPVGDGRPRWMVATRYEKHRAQDPAYRSTRPPPVGSTIRARANVIENRSTTLDLGAMTMAKDLDGTYWYCVDHHRVELFENTDSQNRIGPFETQEEAENALQTIADREKRYEEEDSAWENED
jgi:hypothetical protein